MVKETFSERETWELGEEMGRAALKGQVYSLTGDLGVGKTVFTKGLAAGLGITEPVVSPTFTIVQIYEKKGVCPSIILTYTGSVIFQRWMRSGMRIIFTGTA